MARNEEKAQSMLNRFLRSKKEEASGPRERRPYLASECIDLVEADRWRNQILRDIGKKVMEIQNAGLGEHRIRDLNDEINKLIREKGHWERRIVELGGPDYAKVARVTDQEGNELGGATGRGAGYKYFGAAKQLPGVRELFEKEAPRKVRRTRHQLYKHIDGDYYGFRDEEDGTLLKAEAAAEEQLRKKAKQEWRERRAQAEAAGGSDAGAQPEAEGQQQFVAYVPLPTEQELEQRILAVKKASLLAKYTSEAIQAQQAEAKELLNKR